MDRWRKEKEQKRGNEVKIFTKTIKKSISVVLSTFFITTTAFGQTISTDTLSVSDMNSRPSTINGITGTLPEAIGEGDPLVELIKKGTIPANLGMSSLDVSTIDKLYDAINLAIETMDQRTFGADVVESMRTESWKNKRLFKKFKIDSAFLEKIKQETIRRLEELKRDGNISKLYLFPVIYKSKHHFLYAFNNYWDKRTSAEGIPSFGIGKSYLEHLSTEALAEVLAHEFAPKELFLYRLRNGVKMEKMLTKTEAREIHKGTYTFLQSPLFWKNSGNIVKKETNEFTEKLRTGEIKTKALVIPLRTKDNKKPRFDDTIENTTLRPHSAWLLEDNVRAIESQEKKGQEQLVYSAVLPVEGTSNEAEWAAMGVKLGEPEDGDPLFRKATLPHGWKKVSTGHSMCSNLVDDRGIIRAKIFYKAAFYDRRADVSLVPEKEMEPVDVKTYAKELEVTTTEIEKQKGFIKKENKIVVVVQQSLSKSGTSDDSNISSEMLEQKYKETLQSIRKRYNIDKVETVNSDDAESFAAVVNGYLGKGQRRVIAIADNQLAGSIARKIKGASDRYRIMGVKKIVPQKIGKNNIQFINFEYLTLLALAAMNGERTVFERIFLTITGDMPSKELLNKTFIGLLPKIIKLTDGLELNKQIQQMISASA